MQVLEAPPTASWTLRFDADRLRLMLERLREHGRFSRACDEAHLCVRSVQRLRSKDAEFHEELKAAYLAWYASPKNTRRYRYPHRRGPAIR